MEYGNDRVLPLLRNLSLGLRVISPRGSSRMIQSYRSPSFSSSTVRPSDLTAFAFDITFIAVAISFSVGSTLRALMTGCCGSLFGVSGSSVSDFVFSSERKNCNHLSWIRPLSHSSFPSSSRTYCDSTFLVSSNCTDLMFWKSPCWSPIRNCFSNSTMWRSKKRTTVVVVALRTFFSRLHACLTALRNCASLVSTLRRCQPRLRASPQ